MGLSQKQTAACSRLHEGQRPLLQFDPLEEEAEGPGNSWTTPRKTSYLPASSCVNGSQPLSRRIFDFLCRLVEDKMCSQCGSREKRSFLEILIVCFYYP